VIASQYQVWNLLGLISEAIQFTGIKSKCLSILKKELKVINVNIEQFIDEFKKELDDFMKVWKEGGAINPNNFPSELIIADWYQQFHAFVSCKNNTDEVE